MRVAWCGGTSNEYGWLADKFADNDLSLSVALDQFELQELMARLNDPAFAPDRIILALANRWDFPKDALRNLNCQRPEIPVALCVGDLWAGWKRTGAGHLLQTTFSSIPWFRWIDGWLPWLSGSYTEMFGPFASERFIAPLPRQLQTQVGIVFCLDQSVEEYWNIAPLHEDTRIQFQSPDANTIAANPLSPKWILWDDSCMPTWQGQEFALAATLRELQTICNRFPATKLYLSPTQPTWNLWRELQKLENEIEMLAKPYRFSFSSAALART